MLTSTCFNVTFTYKYGNSLFSHPILPRFLTSTRRKRSNILNSIFQGCLKLKENPILIAQLKNYKMVGKFI